MPVAGNGMVLGLYNAPAKSHVGLGSNVHGNLGALAVFYGKEATSGGDSQMSSYALPLGKAGVTTDPTKSGLVCNTDSIGIPSLAVGKFYIKY